MSSRLMSHFSAISSAPRNWLTSPSPYRATQPGEPVNGSVKPSGSARVIAELIGICDICCTPPATTRSFTPAITAWAAKCTACCAEPHWRSTVVPGTDSGMPATSQQVRAMSPAWPPTESTLPNIDVVDRVGVDAGAVDQRLDRVRAEIGRVDLAQTAAPPAHRASGQRRRCRPRAWGSAPGSWSERPLSVRRHRTALTCRGRHRRGGGARRCRPRIGPAPRAA